MDIRELEAQFREIDRFSQFADIEFDLAGDGITSARLKVKSVETIEAPVASAEGEDGGGGRSGGHEVITEELFDFDLTDVEIPNDFIIEGISDAVERDKRAGRDKLGDLPGVKLIGLGTTGLYEVVEDYPYVAKRSDFGIPPDSERFELVANFTLQAHNGFVYDRASIPRIFWVIISKDDLSNVPPLFHDLFYANGGVLPKSQVSPYATFERHEIDHLFLALMRRSGVTEWRCKLAYAAVRKFSGFAWQTRIV